MSRYRIYTNDNGMVIVVSTYAGKNIRGVAKCNPQDKFSQEIGEQIAQARCDLKIAEKRVKRAREKYDAAVAIFNRASAEVDKAAEYVLHAEQIAVEACKALEMCGESVRN